MSIPATKTKTPQKKQKNNNLLKSKGILNTNISAEGGPIFTFSLPEGAVRPLAPVSYASVCCVQLVKKKKKTEADRLKHDFSTVATLCMMTSEPS